ncbi:MULTISPECIES: thiamine-phosphate kinase [unclassified Spirosoma]|uniref:thiamine-phosphate kinase n=1 Tax=unclassified Spirosoma TaxID=2621999 RepID=UPI00095BE7EA|nr:MULTISPECIES: thiamine-phosphate kinase [unclassified Spirosoma]MBN8825916.1 thiamine-phosphate kinase [Spirosoma sp.]OJW70642.1 MAG: thiamine-phosphate kinase [Spirosoma sp. 48-14]
MTDLNKIGEVGLIERIRQATSAPSHPETIRGIGDDAAVFDWGDQYGLLVTDMLVEGIHFDLSYVPLKHLGYKAITFGVSDIAAMNGLPIQVTVGVALSSRFPVEAIDELYEGIRAACTAYDVDLVGGDTTASRSGLVISVSVLGKVSKELITYRNTAQPNDVVCVTGDLGAAYLGLQLLEREKQVFLADPNMQPSLPEERSYLLQRQLRPDARTDIVHELRDLGIRPTAMIDISDGLASELLHLCHQSGTGAIIFDENIPIDDQAHLAADEFKISPITAALNGGEDYELLFTVRPQEFEKLANHSRITAIGYLTADPSQIVLATKAGQQTPIRAQGWGQL